MVEIAGPLVVLLVGLLFLALAWGNRNHERQRRSRGVVLEGLVVDSEWDMNSTGAVFQAPVVEYVEPDGSHRRFVHRSGTSFEPSVGANVGVWYDPSTGEGPVLHEDRPMQFIMVLFGVLGATVSAGALVMLVRALV
jgi:hypothetical protein